MGEPASGAALRLSRCAGAREDRQHVQDMTEARGPTTRICSISSRTMRMGGGRPPAPEMHADDSRRIHAENAAASRDVAGGSGTLADGLKRQGRLDQAGTDSTQDRVDRVRRVRDEADFMVKTRQVHIRRWPVNRRATSIASETCRSAAAR